LFFEVQDKQDIKRTLEEEARTCQWLVLWLDCDREGENIAYEVVDICAGANRNLDIWRARFSALIPRYWLLQISGLSAGLFLKDHIFISVQILTKMNCREIHDAVQHLARPNKLFADAVDARQVIKIAL
jgi:DNA topoisomerase-3